ncbi:polyprenyl synthetase family protein [Niveibacterium sp. 24ML]|uniref:polyprenyl synthetase family protein n=1 Tax=Niveibacterium sp. 24ML TaxID=2985512 RepID=UPI00226ED878|nr:polyprenyl synthetase family protein [Niveibacterium sp. 24ML]
MSTQELYAPIAADMAAVDGVIRERLHSEVVLIQQVAEYIIAAGGKRLRPALLLFVANALGYRGVHHHELAAVVEFIHTATLLHDDVVDESELRRGNSTANSMFGNAAAVLVGDFLYSRSFQMMVGVNDMRVMRVLADATNVIAEGEVLQLLNVRNADASVDDYLRVIRYKTAMLFEAATRLGAILGGMDEAGQDQLAAFGRHIGTAFQLIDDVLDYSGDEANTGKHLGDDLAEGKPTLPLILVMQFGSPENASIVRRAIEAGGRESFSEVLAAIRASDALERTRAAAVQEVALAKAALSALPASLFKEALLQLSDFAVARDH